MIRKKDLRPGLEWQECIILLSRRHGTLEQPPQLLGNQFCISVSASRGKE